MNQMGGVGNMNLPLRSNVSTQVSCLHTINLNHLLPCDFYFLFISYILNISTFCCGTAMDINGPVKWFRSRNMHLLEFSSQNLNLNPTNNLWRDLKIDVPNYSFPPTIVITCFIKHWLGWIEIQTKLFRFLFVKTMPAVSQTF